jgi:hypothetical protein
MSGWFHALCIFPAAVRLDKAVRFAPSTAMTPATGRTKRRRGSYLEGLKVAEGAPCGWVIGKDYRFFLLGLSYKVVVDSVLFSYKVVVDIPTKWSWISPLFHDAFIDIVSI